MSYMYLKLGIDSTEEKIPHHTMLFYSINTLLNTYILKLIYVIIVLQKQK